MSPGRQRMGWGTGLRDRHGTALRQHQPAGALQTLPEFGGAVRSRSSVGSAAACRCCGRRARCEPAFPRDAISTGLKQGRSALERKEGCCARGEGAAKKGGRSAGAPAAEGRCWEDPCPLLRTGELSASAREEGLWALETFWCNERRLSSSSTAASTRGSKTERRRRARV